jgi:hypothetical protein
MKWTTLLTRSESESFIDLRVGGIPDESATQRRCFVLGTILLIVLILLLLVALPTWPHSRGWGYDPSGGLGLVVLILLILVLMGRI